jgi:hypothetical protein
MKLFHYRILGHNKLVRLSLLVLCNICKEGAYLWKVVTQVKVKHAFSE